MIDTVNDLVMTIRNNNCLNMSSTINDRKIRDVRDIWNCANNGRDVDKENPWINSENVSDNNKSKHKYKTLERHLSMKKTIRKKMMRDLREIGDATADNPSNQNAFLEQIKNDQPPPANIDKPSLWKRLTKGWGSNT
ncbi:hypothetical protein WA026_008582 [Henosepilachna vigintioctopunctata]|uniref:Uncharacterized protein n=1 Tax=Henosepilachna vigintioctopunctata TaxID=420089 RepID=A0AAW1UGX6_9CUCU